MLRLAAVAGLIIVAVAAQSALNDSPADPSRAHGTAFVGCGTSTQGAAPDPDRKGLTAGPFVLAGAQGQIGDPPDAFGGHGYEIRVTLPRGSSATLYLPRGLREEAGLAFTSRIAERASAGGVPAANAAVRFSACAARADRPGEAASAGKEGGSPDQGAPPASARPAGATVRTVWAGGIIVDRPRCVVLEARRNFGDPISRRIPVGRACPSPGAPEAAG